MFAALFALDLAFPLSYLPYMVGSGVATAVAMTIWNRRRNARSALAREVLAGRPKDWVQHDLNATDRRTSIRREGAPVRVFVSAASYQKDLDEGWVLDRSTGGLRLAIKSAIKAGSSVQILAENAPDATPWTTIIVRSCHDAGAHFELGCEFEETPPWSVLLLFG